MTNEYIVIEGVDVKDGSRTELATLSHSSEAKAWLAKYVRSENAGNWDLIEIYDTRGEYPERIGYWESWSGNDGD